MVGGAAVWLSVLVGDGVVDILLLWTFCAGIWVVVWWSGAGR